MAATQETVGENGMAYSQGAAGAISYPDYSKDTETFQQFLQEHTIFVRRRNNQDNDDVDDDLVIPSGMDTDEDRTMRMTRQPCYAEVLQRIRDRRYYHPTDRTFVLEIPVSELVDWNGAQGADLAEAVTRNTLRYHSIFANVIDQVLESLPHQQLAPARDSLDILHEQRMLIQHVTAADQNNNNNNNNPYAPTGQLDPEINENNNVDNNPAEQGFPPILMRRYELRILPMHRRGTRPPFHQQCFREKSMLSSSSSLILPMSLRQVRAKYIGKLVTITGMVVRTSNVQPNCVVAAYSCDACGREVYVEIRSREFLPLATCPFADCKKHLHMQSRGSKFIKYQELKIQELPNQVPMGHVPRSLTVICRGQLTRNAVPGDIVTIDGIFLPQRLAESGYKAMQAGLVATTYLEAQNIIVHKKSFENGDENTELDSAIFEIAQSNDPVGKLAASIAPEIFGHADIKRSLLLQLVGGCTRILPDGMRIRGDINILLMGDPGTAKSQLLKHIAGLAPRGVYTTGKGSSGVGLTAAVTKDTITKEMSLEGGALVLADRGICCIDEFDKMDESDRTALHEVMEQSTVSIAKAGIVATLNARTSVLAAANPLYSRYNRAKTMSENINLPNSLLSRFDLIFLILDHADMERDMALARHVTLVHQNEGGRQMHDDDNDDDDDDDDDEEESPSNETIPANVLREYIARARQYQPVVSPEVAPYVVEAYVSLRMQEAPGRRGRRRNMVNRNAASDQTVMTARQLLSILRLSQALARLRFSDFVTREDVDEAIRLTHMSKASLLDDDNEDGRADHSQRGDVLSKIYQVIRDYADMSGTKEVELKLCEAMILRKGFTVQQLQSCLEEYQALDILQVNRTRTHVYFVDKP